MTGERFNSAFAASFGASVAAMRERFFTAARAL
jgi:hypothetical protein